MGRRWRTQSLGNALFVRKEILFKIKGSVQLLISDTNWHSYLSAHFIVLKRFNLILKETRADNGISRGNEVHSMFVVVHMNAKFSFEMIETDAETDIDASNLQSLDLPIK